MDTSELEKPQENLTASEAPVAKVNEDKKVEEDDGEGDEPLT